MERGRIEIELRTAPLLEREQRDKGFPDPKLREVCQQKERDTVPSDRDGTEEAHQLRGDRTQRKIA